MPIRPRGDVEVMRGPDGWDGMENTAGLAVPAAVAHSAETWTDREGVSAAATAVA